MQVETKELVNASKVRLGKKEALELARSVKHILVAKGKKVLTLDLTKDKLEGDSLAELLLGPTGNLRAPTLRIGPTLLVGFNEEIYQCYLGKKKVE